MAKYMFQGMGRSSRVSAGLALPPKNAKYGSFNPTETKVPTAATSMPRPSHSRWSSKAPAMVIVLDTKPLNTGMPEIDRAATMYSRNTQGSRPTNPPNSVNLAVPAL